MLGYEAPSGPVQLLSLGQGVAGTGEEAVRAGVGQLQVLAYLAPNPGADGDTQGQGRQSVLVFPGITLLLSPNSLVSL